MNDSETRRAAFTIERSFAASAKAVFEAWTSPEVMRRWWHAGAHWRTSHAESDLRVGGALRVVMRSADDGNDYGGGGEYTVVEPCERLAFTWTWDDEPGVTSLVELSFTEHEGRTNVVLTHSGLKAADAAGHEEGWRLALDNLERKALTV